MKIDFVRTKRELARLLEDRLALLSAKHPNITIKRIGLWALSFPKVAKLLVETVDDDAIFGKPARYEYVPREYGGITFDWWPDLYQLKDGDRYEIPLEKDWEIDAQLLVGDDAINLPLFALLKIVLEEACLTGLKLCKEFQLSAEIGAHWLEARWKPGETLKTGPLIRHLAAEFRAREAGLRPKIPTTHEAFKYRLLTIQAGTAVAFDSSGQNLVCFGDRTIRLLDAKTGAQVRSIKCRVSELHGSLAISCDCKLGAAYGPTDSIWVFRLDTGHQEARWITRSKGIQWAAFSPTGEQLAAATWDSTIEVWTICSGTQHTVADNLHALWQLAFSPAGNFLAWVCNDPGRTVVLWDLVNNHGTSIPVKHDPWPHTVAFSPDGRLLATGSIDRINLWNIDNSRVEQIHELEADLADCMSFSPDSRLLASGGEDRAFVLWDTATGQRLRTVANPGKHHTVRRLAFSPDGSLLASSNSDGTVDLWNVKSLCSG